MISGILNILAIIAFFFGVMGGILYMVAVIRHGAAEIKQIWAKEEKVAVFCYECRHHNSLAVCSNPRSINYTVKKRGDDWCGEADKK